MFASRHCRTGPWFLIAALPFAANAHGVRAQTADRPVEPSTPGVTLPAGPAERTLASVGPEIRPPSLPATLGTVGSVPALAPNAWKHPETWDLWARTLALEARERAPDPERRAHLCLLALDQERWDEAWQHWIACSSSPGWVAALLPRLIPGVPPGAPSAAGGLPGALSDGVVLTPALPPPSDGARAHRVDRRAMKVDGLKIGAATIGVRVAVEVEGVQIEIEHQGGGPAQFAVRIPEPAGYAITFEYLDWYRQDTLRAPLALEVRPGDDVRTLYGRLEPRELRLPTQLPERKPAQLDSAGLALLVAREDPERARIDAIARSLAEGPLAIASAVHAVDAAKDQETRGAIVFDLTVLGERERKLAWLVSSVERFALARKP